jgi:hypothetical protein
MMTSVSWSRISAITPSSRAAGRTPVAMSMSTAGPAATPEPSTPTSAERKRRPHNGQVGWTTVDGPPVEVQETPPASAGGADGVEWLVRMVPCMSNRGSALSTAPGSAWQARQGGPAVPRFCVRVTPGAGGWWCRVLGSGQPAVRNLAASTTQNAESHPHRHCLVGRWLVHVVAVSGRPIPATWRHGDRQSGSPQVRREYEPTTGDGQSSLAVHGGGGRVGLLLPAIPCLGMAARQPYWLDC